jgi:minor extracellular serine protease Vpr
MQKVIPLTLLLAVAAFGQPSGRLVEYAVILQDSSVAQTTHSRLALQSPQAKTQLAKIRTAQSSVMAELARRKVPVRSTEQLLVNAIFVSASPAIAAELRNIPGVAHVIPTPPLYMDLDTALDLTNVSAAWSAVGGPSNAGAGIKIGIIDSGIDQNHPGFQDSSLTPPAGFPRADTQADLAFTNNKVIVARSYVSIVAQPFDSTDPMGTAWPDDLSPRDRQGHGTAIAMIAAGAPNNSPRGLIQGVAPKAFLGNYKIFGTPGVNYYGTVGAFVQALQDALSDGMDVVTLSLHEGDPEWNGPLDVDQQACGGQCDVVAQAVESAVANGMVVVAAAGNDGNISGKPQTLTTIHTPGTAPSAITVGATMNAHVLYQSVIVNGSGFGNFHGLFGDGPHVASPLTAPIGDVTASGNDGYACSPLAAGSLSGAVALIQRGNCFDSNKIINAQNAGAIGVVLYLPSGQNTPFSSLGVQDTGIPTMVIGNSDGVALKSYLASHQNTTVTLDPTFQASNTTASAMWPASSRGPSVGTFANTPTTVIKPELVAPGADLYTAAQKYDPNGPVYNSSGYAGVTGTSYAVPMVAGAVALVKQKFGSGLSPAQLKSLVVNTATQDVTDQGGPASMDAAGAGKLSVGDAVNASATLVPDTISFGVINSATVSLTRTVTITNLTGSTATFNITVTQPGSNASVKVSPSTLSLPASQSGNLNVTLSGNQPNPGSYEGFLVVSTSNKKDLHLPFQYLVSSGSASDVFPLCCGTFLFNTGLQQRLFPMRLIDASGVPVPNAQLRFSVTKGTATIQAGDSLADLLGTGYVSIDFGSVPGEQTITGTSGGLTQTWDGVTMPFPSISPNGAVDAATFQTGQGLAPGSYISIFGAGLSDSQQQVSTPYLPISLSTISVSFFGSGMALPGHLSFVSPGQVNVQIPSEFAGQSSVTLKVNFGGLESNLVTVPLNTYSPGVFPGPAVQDSNYQLITSSNPARRGDTIIIYANGLGPVSNQPASGDPSPSQPLAQTNLLPSVTIGGVAAEVDFSGLTPGFVGLYQINAKVPAGAQSGSQPLVVTMNGIPSTPVNLAVQ